MTFSQRRPVSAEQYQESGEQIPTGTPGQMESLEDARPPASAKRGTALPGAEEREPEKRAVPAYYFC